MDLKKPLQSIRTRILRRAERLLDDTEPLIIERKMDLRDIQNLPGIYFIFRKEQGKKNQAWQLRRVGKHKRVKQRVREHLFYADNSSTNHGKYRVEDHPGYVYGVVYWYVEPVAILEYVEHVLIETLRPIDNVHG